MAIVSPHSGTRLGRRLFFAAPAVLVAGVARAQSSEITFKKSSLEIVSGDRKIKFDVELALNDAERSHGLMFREKLGAYDGMLFDFYQDAPVSFWMKNTLIPLDIIFVRTDGTIVNIAENTVPLSLDPVPSLAARGELTESSTGTRPQSRAAMRFSPWATTPRIAQGRPRWAAARSG